MIGQFGDLYYGPTAAPELQNLSEKQLLHSNFGEKIMGQFSLEMVIIDLRL